MSVSWKGGTDDAPRWRLQKRIKNVREELQESRSLVVFQFVGTEDFDTTFNFSGFETLFLASNKIDKREVGFVSILPFCPPFRSDLQSSMHILQKNRIARHGMR